MIDTEEIFRDPRGHIGALTHFVGHVNDPQLRKHFRLLADSEQTAFMQFLRRSRSELEFAQMLVQEQEGEVVSLVAAKRFVERAAELRAILERDLNTSDTQIN
jgi:hypothetical protein